jgi:ribosome-binding protein aMBF1 (putative translation factor)
MEGLCGICHQRKDIVSAEGEMKVCKECANLFTTKTREDKDIRYGFVCIIMMLCINCL